MKQIFIDSFESLKDWRKVVRYAKYYAIACGIGLNIYWIYITCTNI